MSFIKFVRIFLLILIIIGLSLIATEKIWVPKIVDKIISKENPNTETQLDLKGKMFVYQKGLSAIDQNLQETNLGTFPFANDYWTMPGYYNGKIYFTKTVSDYGGVTLYKYDIQGRKTEPYLVLSTSTSAISGVRNRFLIDGNMLTYLGGVCVDSNGCWLGEINLDTLQNKVVIRDLETNLKNDIGLKSFTLYNFSAKENTVYVESSYSGMDEFEGYMYRVNLTDGQSETLDHLAQNTFNGRKLTPEEDSDYNNFEKLTGDLDATSTRYCGNLKFEFSNVNYSDVYKISLVSDPNKNITHGRGLYDDTVNYIGCGD